MTTSFLWVSAFSLSLRSCVHHIRYQFHHVSRAGERAQKHGKVIPMAACVVHSANLVKKSIPKKNISKNYPCLVFLQSMTKLMKVTFEAFCVF